MGEYTFTKMLPATPSLDVHDEYVRKAAEKLDRSVAWIVRQAVVSFIREQRESNPAVFNAVKEELSPIAKEQLEKLTQ